MGDEGDNRLDRQRGAKMSLEGEATITMYPLCTGGTHELLQLQGHKASGARRNIVPPQILEKSLGATINYHATKYGPPTYDVSFPSGAEWLVLEYNDLYFAFVKVGHDAVIAHNLLQPDAINAEGEINEAEINSASLLSCVDPKVWAPRLGTGVDGLKRIKKAVKGMDSMKAPTNVDTHIIEHDKHRRGQVAKRQPTNVERDPRERIYTPGSRFVVDGFTFPGREQVTQIPTRTGAKAPTCCLTAVDDSDSNYVYAWTSDTHTTDDWFNFLSHVHAAEKVLHHNILVFKFDRAPEIDCERLKRRVESELHVRVLIGPSGEHECVARAEQLMDTTARATEAMLQRAKRNLGADPRRYQALAHKHALYLHNRRPDKDGKPTRMQRHCGRVPDFGDKNGMTPYVFGCQVIRLRDENERTNWKGAGKRVADGIFVGIEHSSYMVFNPTTGKLTFEPFIWPLDEIELSRTGMAAGATQHDAACQIELSTAEPLVLLPPKNQARVPTPKEPVVSVDAPIGTRIKVFWQGVKNQPELDKWYEGTIVTITTLANGQLRHVVKYDGWPDEHVHDLVNGGKQWMRLVAILPPTVPSPVGPAAVPAPDADQWTTIGKAGRAIKPAVHAAEAPTRTTRHSQPAQSTAPIQVDAVASHVKPAEPSPAGLASAKAAQKGFDKANELPQAHVASRLMQFGHLDPKTGGSVPKPPARATRHSPQRGEVSVAELAEAALERGEATPSMAQIVVEHLMGDGAPAFLKGDTVESILERVVNVPYTSVLRQSADAVDLSKPRGRRSSTSPRQAPKRSWTSRRATLRSWPLQIATRGSRQAGCLSSASRTSGATRCGAKMKPSSRARSSMSSPSTKPSSTQRPTSSTE